MKENWLTRLFSGRSSGRATIPAADKAKMRQLAQMVAATQDTECTCDEAFRLMDEYLERRQNGEDVGRLMPQIHHHLSLCACCAQELAALEAIIGDAT